jgi:hypothetical protein
MITNLRLGHACNSSSTHSLLILGPDVSLRDNTDGEFGWEFFTASSQESKRRYVAESICYAIEDAVGSDMAWFIAKSLAGLDRDLERGYIDHQSIPLIPTNWEGKMVDEGFVEAWRRWMDRDDVAILGGNDNTDERHPAMDLGEGARLPSGEGHPLYVCRQDGNHWTMFSRETGARFTMDLSPRSTTMESTEIPKGLVASSPWLVDIKITDACNAGCAFCYQGSTQTGEHADANYLRNVFYKLGKDRCFEVAIGGGEPTLHPDFLGLMAHARTYGIVPNVTTRNLDFLASVDRGKELAGIVGRVAVSVDGARDAQRAVDLLKLAPWWKGKINLQIIDGICADPGHVLAIAEVASRDHDINVTLLGYKTVGRGSLVKPPHLGAWREDWRMKQLKTGNRFPFLVDTAFLATYANDPIINRAHTSTVQRREGVVSAFIDGVAKVMRPSSYDTSSVAVPIPNPSEDMGTAWQKVRWAN